MLCGAPASHGPGSGVSVAHGPGAREIPGTEPEPFHKKEKWGTGQTLGRRKIPEITRSISKLSERRDVGRGLGIHGRNIRTVPPKGHELLFLIFSSL